MIIFIVFFIFKMRKIEKFKVPVGVFPTFFTKTKIKDSNNYKTVLLIVEIRLYS